ncbi:MAG: hypothetical protein HY890_05035 [Deltaproteobacteria bacterium]|nr:hypothetical protein [Deltaproteobacteria bacterium]
MTAAVEYEEFLRALTRAMGHTSLYSVKHPVSRRSVASCHARLAGLLDNLSELNVANVDGKILVNGVPLQDIGHSAGLAGAFTRLKLHSVVFLDGITLGELTDFLTLLNSDGKTSICDTFDAAASPHIKVNAVHYIKTGEAGPSASAAAVEDTEQWAGSLSDMTLDGMIKNVVERAVPKAEDRRRILDLVMSRFRSEVDGAVRSATGDLEKEKTAILQDKERTERIVAGGIDGLITVDDSGRVLMINPEGERVLGARLKDRVARPVWEGLGTGQMVVLAPTIFSNHDDGDVAARDVVVRGEDDTARTLRASNALIRDREGRMVGIFSVLSDVTKYRELDRMKRDFVASVTHELRTPVVATKQALSNILGLTGGLGEDQKKMLSIALRNTERLSRLINDILDFSKLDSGNMRIRQEIVETAPLLKEIIATIKPLADSRGIKLLLDAPSAPPRLFVDRDRTVQVFVNLLSNAIKFTAAQGTVGVGIEGARESGGGVFLEIAVRDTGCGMKEEDLGRIFEKFVQVGAHGATALKGTGLGLTITKAIVELHGGDIRVESYLGRGSVFTVALPMMPEDAVFLREGGRDRCDRLNGRCGDEKNGLLERFATRLRGG